MKLILAIVAACGIVVAASTPSAANAAPFCFETGPGYQKCVTSGHDLTPIYQGPTIYSGGNVPWVPSYSSPPVYVPPPAPIYLPPSPPVNANIGPAPASECIHADMNTVTIASDGSNVRCLNSPGAGYRWLPDTGQTQVDPAIAGQGAWNACMSTPGNTAPDCRCKVDGNCG